MKKLFTILALSLVCAICAFGFAACEDSNDGSNTDTTHTHEYMEMVITPTCTAGGYTMYVCTCKEWYKDNETAALGHSYEWTITKQPTETEDGVKTGVCTRCGDIITQSIPALNHEHNYIITVIPATCTTNGYTLHKCACGNEYTDNEISVLGHNYEWATTKEPTETEEGQKQGVCTRCGDAITQSIPKLNHEHNYIITVIPATCTTDGYTLHKCGCGDEYITDETPALGHNYQAETTPPNCTEQGYTTYTCTRCGNSYINDYVLELGHNYNEGVCAECGAEDPEHVAQQLTSDEYFTFTLLRDDTYEINVQDKNNLPAEVILPSIHDGKAVTSIGYEAFSYCSSLTNITIPNGVTSIGNMAFCVCSSLTSITIPNSVTSIGQYAFAKCSSLTSITIPDSVTSIEYHLFDDCSSLTSIIIPISVMSIDTYAFSECRSLKSIVVDDGNPNYSSQDGILYNKNKTEIIRAPQGINEAIILPDTLMSIRYQAFECCSGLTSIIIPDSVTSIGSWAFGYCYSLTSIAIPDSVTSIGIYAFYECRSLTSITIPDSVTSIEKSTFDGSSSLIRITIPDSLTSIGDYAFRNCSSLTNVTIPDSVTSIGYGVFYGCNSLKSIVVDDGNPNYSSQDGILYNKAKTQFLTIPQDISGAITLPNTLTSIGDNAFSGRSNLTSVTISDSITNIGQNAFYGCPCVEINNGISYVDKWLIKADYSIISATIKDNTVGIADNAFTNCSSLTDIIIPANVTSIGYNAFYGCSSLTSVIFEETKGWRVSLAYEDDAMIVSNEFFENAYYVAYALNNAGEYYWQRG